MIFLNIKTNDEKHVEKENVLVTKIGDVNSRSYDSFLFKTLRTVGKGYILMEEKNT